ncbi:hypothetical protein QTL86_11320 [Cellulosilyticum sp. ST5]|uniref:hypothetical protein n=1 Tax=Cellulosilyticum sp. ST5 TaxID=3055805 RepID=UPI003977AB76
MGQVILSLEEYEKLRKQADAVAELSKCFVIVESFNEKEVTLSIPVAKAAEIFKAMFVGSKYDDGTFEIHEDIRNYNISVADYYIKAVKKKEKLEEAEAQAQEEPEEESKGGPF